MSEIKKKNILNILKILNKKDLSIEQLTDILDSGLLTENKEIKTKYTEKIKEIHLNLTNEIKKGKINFNKGIYELIKEYSIQENSLQNCEQELKNAIEVGTPIYIKNNLRPILEEINKISEELPSENSFNHKARLNTTILEQGIMWKDLENRLIGTIPIFKTENILQKFKNQAFQKITKNMVFNTTPLSFSKYIRELYAIIQNTGTCFPIKENMQINLENTAKTLIDNYLVDLNKLESFKEKSNINSAIHNLIDSLDQINFITPTQKFEYKTALKK